MVETHHRRPRLLTLVLALLLLGFATACKPGIKITSPAHGIFTTAAAIVIDGKLTNVNSLATVNSIKVNGVSVNPTVDKTFQTVVTLDQNAIVNPIVAEVTFSNGTVVRDRITVMAGESVADGDFSEEGVALRIRDQGLDDLEPLVTGLVNFNLATLVPPGTLVIDDYCYASLFGACIGRVDASISGDPAPSLGGFGIEMDSMTDFVAGDIELTDLALTADVVAVSGIGFTCHIDIDAATTNILGDFGLDPHAADPTLVDVSQIGGAEVLFGGFADDTDCEGFLGFVVEAFVDLFIDDVQGMMRDSFEDFLNQTNAAGNTPIASAIEGALAGVEISGPIGQAIGVNLETPMFDIPEDGDGLTLGTDARITASMPDPQAVNLLASYHVSETFPTFGPTAPNGQAYDLAMSISTSAFNQLLKAETESGLLRTSIDEIDLGGGPLPLTAGLLSFFLPTFGQLNSAEALRVDLAPTMAPIVTGEPGAGGELANLKLPHLLVSVVKAADGKVLLQAAVDADLGLDGQFGDGALVFALTPPLTEDVGFTLLHNPLNESEAKIEDLLPLMIDLLLPQLGDSLGTFPLPVFLGLELEAVDVDRSGEFMSLFLNFS